MFRFCLNDTDKLLIAGKTPYTLQEALNKGIINQTDYDGYVNAINNAGISYGSGVYGPDDFYLYVDDNNRIHFALISDVNDNSGAAVTYDYIANGAYTKNTEYDYTQLEFDVSTGRITSITIPTTYDAEGKPLTYTTIDVSAETVTDEAAYQDAYAQYEYEQYLYDKKRGVIVSGEKNQVSYLSQAWMILSEVLTQKESMRAMEHVLSMPDACYPGCPYGYHYVMEALLKCGMNDEARKLMIDYWGGMISKGADTFWEVYDPDNDALSPYGFFPVNSYCHAWSCTPCYFYRKYFCDR